MVKHKEQYEGGIDFVGLTERTKKDKKFKSFVDFFANARERSHPTSMVATIVPKIREKIGGTWSYEDAFNYLKEFEAHGAGTLIYKEGSPKRAYFVWNFKSSSIAKKVLGDPVRLAKGETLKKGDLELSDGSVLLGLSNSPRVANYKQPGRKAIDEIIPPTNGGKTSVVLDSARKLHQSGKIFVVKTEMRGKLVAVEIDFDKINDDAIISIESVK